MSQDIATPETLDQLADDHSAQGLLVSAATFRAMAKSWRATERELHLAQVENSQLHRVLSAARLQSRRAEELATSMNNVLAQAPAIKSWIEQERAA